MTAAQPDPVATDPRAAVSRRDIVVRYIAFAVVSTIVNLGAQAITFRYAPIAPLYAAILAGTAAGFAVRYALEKKWVFYDAYQSHADEARKFALYGVMGIGTTVIFWAFEIGGQFLTGSAFGRYTGAVIGLAIGYVVKYQLDKTFVFRPGSAL